MGFVKGMITGVFAVAGVVVGAAVICAIKDLKKEKAEMKKASEEMDRMFEEDDKAYEDGMKEFEKYVGNRLDRMSDVK